MDELIRQAKAGEPGALERLVAPYVPALRRWVAARLPYRARDLMNTDELVRNTVLDAVRCLDAHEPMHEAAFEGYLRQAVMERMCTVTHAGEAEPDGRVSLLEAAIGQEAVERYEAALTRLLPHERNAVIVRVELGRSFEEIATALGRPSPEAARDDVSQALLRLAEEMSRGI